MSDPSSALPAVPDSPAHPSSSTPHFQLPADSLAEVESGEDPTLSNKESALQEAPVSPSPLRTSYKRCTDNLREYCSKALLPPLDREPTPDELERWRSVAGSAIKIPVEPRDEEEGTDVTMRSASAFLKPSRFTSASRSSKGTIGKGTATARHPEEWRRFENVVKVDDVLFNRCVLDYHKTISSQPLNVPDMERTIHGREAINMPASGFTVQEPWLAPASDENGVGSWVLNGPLSTTTRVVHLLDPDTKEYTFKPATGAGTQQLKADLSWRTTGISAQSQLVVEVKPPWHFENERGDICGLIELWEMGNFPVFGTKTEPYTGAECVWAQVHDYCFKQRVRYFVITTYDGWLFGAFSKQYRQAYVMRPKRYDASEPTVIQCLVYWTLSAMGDENGWKIPLVRNEPDPSTVWHGLTFSHYGLLGFPRRPYAALAVARAR